MKQDVSTQAGSLADDPARGRPCLPLWAASLTIETGLLHLIACSDHFREWWGYGVFFLVVALCQIVGGAALLVKSSRGLYLTGIVGMAIVLAVWAVSRTVGVPIGPEGVGPEPIGLLDGACTLLEVTVICFLLRLLRHPSPAPLVGALDGNPV